MAAMTTRRRLLVFGLLAGVLAVGGGVWLLWPRTAITRENAAKIQKGMTRAEVEAILGGPARNDTTSPVDLDLEDLLNSVGDRGLTWWKSDQAAVWLAFDSEERVIGVAFAGQHRRYDGFLNTFRRWLRL